MRSQKQARGQLIASLPIQRLEGSVSLDFKVYQVSAGTFRVLIYCAEFGNRWMAFKDENGKTLDFESEAEAIARLRVANDSNFY